MRLRQWVGRSGMARTTASVIVGAFLVVALAGCTPNLSSPTPSPTRTETTSPTTSAQEPSEVTSYSPPGEKVIASLNNQTSSNTAGSFETGSKFINVYLTCAGPGNIFIKVSGIGRFELPCLEGDVVPSKNQFEVSSVKSYELSVESTENQKWALSMTETESSL